TTVVWGARRRGCCSTEQIGMQRTELARKHREISRNVRSPIARLGTGRSMLPPSISSAPSAALFITIAASLCVASAEALRLDYDGSPGEVTRWPSRYPARLTFAVI